MYSIFAKKQNTTLGTVKSANFLIYEERFFTKAYFTLETTRLGFIVSTTSLGIKSCQVFVWSICNLTELCTTFYCLPYYNTSHLGWTSRISYAVHIQYILCVYHKHKMKHLCLVYIHSTFYSFLFNRINTNITSLRRTFKLNCSKLFWMSKHILCLLLFSGIVWLTSRERIKSENFRILSWKLWNSNREQILYLDKMRNFGVLQ